MMLYVKELSVFQIIRRFDFFTYVAYTMYLNIIYI
jgi:hypothetical protein